MSNTLNLKQFFKRYVKVKKPLLKTEATAISGRRYLDSLRVTFRGRVISFD